MELKSRASFLFWLARREAALPGRRDCRVGCQRRGIEAVKSEGVGRTDRHGARRADVSRQRSRARREWIVGFGVLGRERMRVGERVW